MEKIAKAWCFFEQSGTFKNEFIKLGIPAVDLDIQDNFGQTDHQCDLFAEIETAYQGGASVFDSVKPDDLIMAFFPCIFFCGLSQALMYPTNRNYRKKTIHETCDLILKRNADRAYFYSLLMKLFCIVRERGLRMIVENPYSMQTYLKANFENPTFVDADRSRRGDFYVKPTAYWFVNITLKNGFTYQKDKKLKSIVESSPSVQAGLCSEERSMISPDYARNFICDNIIGKVQTSINKTLFD